MFLLFKNPFRGGGSVVSRALKKYPTGMFVHALKRLCSEGAFLGVVRCTLRLLPRVHTPARRIGFIWGEDFYGYGEKPACLLTKRRALCAVFHTQHILGSCSPASISRILLLPIDVSRRTFDFGSSTTVPIMVASLPSGWPFMA